MASTPASVSAPFEYPVPPRTPSDDTHTRHQTIPSSPKTRNRASARSSPPPLNILLNLPKENASAFGKFNPSVPDTPAHVYLPSHQDVSPDFTQIPVQRRRCLIRTISRPPITHRSVVQPPTNYPPSTAAISVPHPVNPPNSAFTASSSRRDVLSPEAKRRRRGVAAVSASANTAGSAILSNNNSPQLRVSRSNSSVHKHNNTLSSQQPRIHTLSSRPLPFGRNALAESVQSWSVSQLREYLLRAGIRPGAMSRAEMARIVLLHLATDVNAGLSN